MSTIAFLGDLHCAEVTKIGLPQRLCAASGDSYLVVNFEGALAEQPRFANDDSRVRLCQSAAAIDTLVQAPRYIAGLANNHIADLGGEAVLRTVATIRRAGGVAIGVGGDPEAALAPVIVAGECNEVAIFALTVPEIGSATAGLHSTPDIFCADARNPLLADKVAAEKSMGRRAIAYIHWDLTNHSFPSPGTRRLAKKLVSMGFDAIIGHHSHVLQGREYVDGKPVFYSLGNAAFDPYLVRGKQLSLPISNRRSVSVLYSTGDATIVPVGLMFDVGRRAIEEDDGVLRRLRLLSLPLRMRRTYPIFYRLYLLWRLFGRALYWSRPSRLVQAGDAQWKAVKRALASVIGVR